MIEKSSGRWARVLVVALGAMLPACLTGPRRDAAGDLMEPRESPLPELRARLARGADCSWHTRFGETA